MSTLILSLNPLNRIIVVIKNEIAITFNYFFEIEIMFDKKEERGFIVGWIGCSHTGRLRVFIRA